MTAFDFEAAVTAPFRMQPGLRRLAPGSPQLTPIAPGSRHQREKLAVLSAFADDALQVQPGFDPHPALNTLCTLAASEQPGRWHWDGHRAQADWLGTSATIDGEVQQLQAGVFGLGDEVARCLQGLPEPWRLAGLAALAFAEDFAVVDGRAATLPWLAVCLPSHWAPRDKIGRSLAEVHGPVADNDTLVKASAALVNLVTGSDRWERFVWNVTPHARLHAHPARHDDDGWQHTTPAGAWWRTERQSFVPYTTPGGEREALFAIGVDVQPLASAVHSLERALALHDAVASMSEAVLRYRGLQAVREPLLAWLHAQAEPALRATAP